MFVRPNVMTYLDFEHFIVLPEKSMTIQMLHGLQCVILCCDNHVTVHLIGIMAITESGLK